MGEVGENDMLQLIHLLLQSLIDFRIAVAQKIAPPGGNNVQVFLAMGVIKVYPFAVVCHHRRKYFVILHLHGRMPDVFFIFLFPVNVCHLFTPLLMYCYLVWIPVVPVFVKRGHGFAVGWVKRLCRRVG